MPGLPTFAALQAVPPFWRQHSSSAPADGGCAAHGRVGGTDNPLDLSLFQRVGFPTGRCRSGRAEAGQGPKGLPGVFAFLEFLQEGEELDEGRVLLLHGRGGAHTRLEGVPSPSDVSLGQPNGAVQPRAEHVGCNRLLGVIMHLAPEYNMGGLLRRHELHAFVSQGWQVDALEESLSPSQQNRRDGHMQLINEALTKVLLNGVRTTTNAHVHPVGGLARLVESLMNAACDKMERRVAFHLYGRARVMGQDEDGNVIGRVVPPPPLPFIVWPRPTDRSEHVPSEDPGADILEAPRGEVLVDAGRALVATHDVALECPRREEPLVELLPANAERIVDVLIRTCSVSVERDGEAFNSYLGHLVRASSISVRCDA